jgi:hypothetical protein
MRSGLLGQMVTPNSGNRLIPNVVWALDNGCFNARWDEGRWMATLERYADVPGCLFAVVADVVADASATDERWTTYAAKVKALGYRAAYVVQNGCREVPTDADAVFIGGDTIYKLGVDAQRLAADARARGLWTHMGRVNSLRRLRFAAWHGYDSVDGTFLAFGPDINLPKLLGYLGHAAHPTLFKPTESTP